MSGRRLPSGGIIDRRRPISFEWQGKQLEGYVGDTLASALLATGKGVIGRSFKYHRPRGIIAAGYDEPNAIVQVELGADTIPNLKATTVELYDGLKARPVNVLPNAEHDSSAIIGLFKRFIPAAFYYKTFMWPNWHLFEPSIRKMAGLGVAPTMPDRDSYDHHFAHCETLVIGGGISGMLAALDAANAGEDVVLVTGGAVWGGRLAGSMRKIDGKAAVDWIDSTLQTLQARGNVRLFNRTLATGAYDHGMVALCQRLTDHKPLFHREGPRQTLWKIRADRIVFATGAFERPLVFPNNDRPGVMLASAADTYMCRHGVAVGGRVAVATNNDSAWDTAFALANNGVTVVSIIDARPDPGPEFVARARALGIDVVSESVPVNVVGRNHVRALRVARLDQHGGVGKAQYRIDCDAVLMSGGWNPAVHLHSQAGGSLNFHQGTQSFIPDSARTWTSVGAAAGDYDLAGRVANGQRSPVAMRSIWSISPSGTPDASAWVDFQNDVTAADIALAARENYRSVEHLKRYTTLGMASDQGKTSNVNGIGVLSELLDKPIPTIGTTRFRPPYDPTTIGVFAGKRVGSMLMPQRSLAAEERHLALGAEMEDYGGWRRPACYRRGGEDERSATIREVTAVRTGVGLFEASPLGKIEVKGPDAATFLDRVYANDILSLKIGHCRYGLMLTEHGIVFDDGIVARLGDDHFLVGTTSANAAAVFDVLQDWLQCEWPDLQVLTEDVTTCWGVINVAGPSARALIEQLGTTVALSHDAFPHMTVRTGRLLDMPCRIQRVSFSGELSYEISVPWDGASRVWEAAMCHGEDLGITPFGIEAMMTMRIEKGFLLIGSETDGTTIPRDLGYNAMIERKKRDYIGRRSLFRLESQRADRRQMVGLELDASDAQPLRVGAHILPAEAKSLRPSEGWVTSSVWSPTLRHTIALALIERGRMRIGEEVGVWDLGQRRTARIVNPVIFDPTGARLHG